MASASPVRQEEEAGWPAVSRCISYLLGTSEHGTNVGSRTDCRCTCACDCCAAAAAAAVAARAVSPPAASYPPDQCLPCSPLLCLWSLAASCPMCCCPGRPLGCSTEASPNGSRSAAKVRACTVPAQRLRAAACPVALALKTFLKLQGTAHPACATHVRTHTDTRTHPSPALPQPIRATAAAGPPPVSVHSRMQRLFRVSDAALRRGLTMGSLAGVYVGVQALLAVHRGRRSYLPDSFCGGAAVASVYAGGALRRAVLLCCSVDRGFCCGAHSGGHLPVSSAPPRPPPRP